jgi:hypothetical protein
MNERIKELAEQAGISLYKKDVLDKHFPELYDGVYCESSVEQLEKFAELIIDICRNIAEDGFHEEIDGQEINDKIARYFRG